MSKNKPNEVVYHVLSHHIHHYKQAKKYLKYLNKKKIY